MSDQPDASTTLQTLQTLQTELSTLDRVFHRLAMTDAGPSLEKVLSLLLPRLLSRIGKNDDAKQSNKRGANKRKLTTSSSDGDQDTLDEAYETIHKKLIEMLMHVMKRVRDDSECRLPCGAILGLLAPPTEDEVMVNSFTVNLSLAFLTLGVNRCTPAECCAMLPGLLKFLESLLVGTVKEETGKDVASVGVDHLIDPSRKMRYNQTWHLILRCLEKVSHNPLENAAARRAASKSESSVSSQSADVAATSISVSSLADTKELLLSRHILSAAIFDLFLDIFVYSPVPAASILIPNGMSTAGYQCLTSGAAGEKSGCKSWKEEFATRAKLKELKLKLLDLIAPCRRFAIFLPDVIVSEETADVVGNVAAAVQSSDGLGMSRTVALMVLLSGDADLDVKSKAESYLKAHMDTYRGQDAPADSVSNDEDKYDKANDPLLGNQVALTNSLLSYVIGGLSSNDVAMKVLIFYKSSIASNVAETRLCLVYSTMKDDEAHQKALLSSCRMKLADSTIAPTVKFVAKMLEDNPKLFHVMDMADDEADIAAVCIASLSVTIFGDLWRPGSSGSSAVEAAASLLNALCLRLSLFYESREQKSSKCLHALLTKSMGLACSVLAPISSGESTSLSGTGTRVATIQLDIRDKMYGVISTLARSKRFSLHERYSLFDCGYTDANTGAITATAKMLYGCATNEVETLRPRAVSALDALLAAYVRVVKVQMKESKCPKPAVKVPVANPWATDAVNEPHTNSTEEQSKINDFTDRLSRSLLRLLWSASRRSQTKSSRLAAARWSEELLMLLDSSSAYHLLCFLSGDDDASVSVVSKKALGIDTTIGEDVSLNAFASVSNQGCSVSFSELVAIIMGEERINGRPSYKDFHVRAQAASLRCLLQLLLSEGSFYGDEQVVEFTTSILQTLTMYKNRSLTRDESDLLDECSISLAALTSSSHEAREIVVGHGFEDIGSQAVKSSSSKARRHFAEVMRNLFEDQSLWLTDISSNAFWINTSGLLQQALLCRGILETMHQASYVLGEVHGAAFLGSSCVRAFNRIVSKSSVNATDEADSKVSQCWEICSGIVSLLGKGLSHSELVIGNSCSRGLMIAFDYTESEAPSLDSRLFESMAIALHGTTESLKRFSSIDHADPTRASSLIHASGVLLAASTTGAGSTELGPARLQCTESLFSVLGSTVHRKDEELSLAVGEALVKYADAIGFGDWGSAPESSEDGPYKEEVAFSLPPHKHILYTIFKREIIATNPVKKTGCAALLLAIVGHASRIALLDQSLALRIMVKEVFVHLQQIQRSFIELLKDPKSKQLARECCCRGLAACRGLSLACKGDDSSGSVSETLNDLLLKAFGQTSNYGQSAMMESEEQARERRNQERSDTMDLQQVEVGGAAGMGEAALGAYREMANAALAIDRPDILYTLMVLSTNHPIWLSNEARDFYSTKSLLGHAEGFNDGEIRSALKPHLGKLAPSIIRASNDVNKSDQMKALWIGLTGGGSEARDVITCHLISILDTLMKDAVSKLWRTRAGACGALSDIIVGRSWEDLGGGDVEEDVGDMTSGGAAVRLLRLWNICVRALDDVRTPVRERGESLGRSLRALTIRLCDPLASNMTAEEEAYMSYEQQEQYKRQREENAEKAATVSLGWLVKHGLNQPCPEATGICVSCLLGVVDIAKPATLQPVLDSLIGALLMAMSGLEPAALNYLQVRAAGNDQGNNNENYDRLESARVRIAMSGPVFSALNKCLDMIKQIDVEAQKKIVPELDSALRRGAGFATRAATADAVASLCSTCPSAFTFPGTSTSNPSVRLFRALYFASERERGQASKDKMTHALGSLAELVPGNAVRTLAAKACERYSESSGSNNDPSVRKAAAATVRAIVVRATSQMQDGGPKDVWIKVVLPTAFLGRHDKDEKVASLWNEVWEEGGAVVGSRDDSFGVLLQEKILPSLNKSIIDHLQSTSWSNRISACAVITELANANILAPTPCSTDGSSDGGTSQERFRIRAAASCSILFECVKIIARGKIWAGKGDVIQASTQIAGKWTGRSLLNEDMNIVPLVFDSNSQEDLFLGDEWFKSLAAEQEDEQEINCVEEEKVTGDEKDLSENETALDLSDEPAFDDEDTPNNSSTETTQNITSLTFLGYCRLLCDQGLRVSSNGFTEGVLPYKSAAMGSLSSFLQTVVAAKGSEDYNKIVNLQKETYNLLAPRLYAFVLNSFAGESSPPLLVAKSLECLASTFYDGVGGDQSLEDYFNSLAMLKFFTECSGPKQPAWSVRQSAVLAASSLVSKMPCNNLCKNTAVITLLDCSSHALKDRKFWKVRQAGLEVLLSLVTRIDKQRASDTDRENQLLLEAVLPYKEKIISLARQSLSDNESQVTAMASQITLLMAWWP